MQVANLGYDNFLGRLGIGRVYEWAVKVGQDVTVTSNEWVQRKGKITEILTNEGLEKVKAKKLLLVILLQLLVYLIFT